jgi:hypothetical protein
MTFYEALTNVVQNGVVALRKTNQFAKGGYNIIDWSIWMRIRLDDSCLDEESLLLFESNNYDDENNKWLMGWDEDQLSRADVLASDWEIVQEQE